MSAHYHEGKANVVADALKKLCIGSKTHADDGNKELVKDVHRLERLGVQSMDSTRGGASVHPSSGSSLVDEFKKGQYLDPMLMDLKKLVLIKMNESFNLGGDDILSYQDSLCVPDVDDLQNKIFA